MHATCECAKKDVPYTGVRLSMEPALPSRKGSAFSSTAASGSPVAMLICIKENKHSATTVVLWWLYSLYHEAGVCMQSLGQKG
jgi:hypothetical protein